MSNEITVKLKCTSKELCKILENKGFDVYKKFIVDDIYYIPKDIEISESNPRDILKTAVLLRKITEILPESKEIKKITIKKKDIDSNGNIKNQEKIDCEINDIEQGKKFIEALGFKELMKIKEYDIKYIKENLALIIKHIEEMEEMMEVELVEDDKRYDSIDKVINEVKKLNIPIDTSDYFVKKAEIKLESIMNKRNLEGEEVGVGD